MGEAVKNISALVPARISRDQARDTGMAMVLLCLLVWLFTGVSAWVVAAICLLVLDMTWPMAFKPLGYLWFGLSNALGAVVSRVLLTAVFFLLVVPVGRLRRVMGKDSLALARWKESSSSVFVTRGHRFKPEDVEHPF